VPIFPMVRAGVCYWWHSNPCACTACCRPFAPTYLAFAQTQHAQSACLSRMPKRQGGRACEQRGRDRDGRPEADGCREHPRDRGADDVSREVPSLKYASLEQAAPKRSLKVLKPGLSMLDRPRSNASAPCCFSSWIAFQNNIGIAPSLLKAESEQPYL